MLFNNNIMNLSFFNILILQAVNVGKDIPLPLPVPEWLLVLVLVVMFLVHLLFINLMFGGTLLTLVFEVMGLKNDDYHRLSQEIAGTITVNKSLAVVMGVAPLLAINTLYTKFFYTANALTGLVWILVIPSVTVAFLLLYLHKYTYQTLNNNRPLHIAILTLPMAIFLFTPLVFLTNINLMLFPDRWAAIGGFMDALALPNVFPRYFHFFNASLTATALFLFWYLSRKSYDFESLFHRYSRYDFQKRFYSIAFACSVAQFVFGPIVLFTLPAHGLSMSMILTILAGASVALVPTVLLWKEITGDMAQIGRYFRPIAGLLLVTVVFMGSGRHLYRSNALKPYQAQLKANTAAYLAAVEEAKLNPPAEPSGANPASGQGIFETRCGVCHAKDQKLVGPPVKEMVSIYGDNRAGLIQWIKKPGKKRPDYPQMPGFEGQLSDQELNAVADYVLKEALAAPKPTAADDAKH